MANVVKAENLQPLGYEQISAPAAATALTVPPGATYALIQTVGQNIRFTDDGTTPTAALGMQLQAGDALFYKGHLHSLLLIEESAGAEVNVLYYS